MQRQSHLLGTSKSYKRTKSIAARFRPIYVCVDCLPFPISFIRTKTEFDSQNWPWKSNEDRLVTMCCIFCYLILVHPLIDLYCLHSSEWGIVCVTSSAFMRMNSIMITIISLIFRTQNNYFLPLKLILRRWLTQFTRNVPFFSKRERVK